MKENMTERERLKHEAANMVVSILMAIVIGICIGLGLPS